MSRFLFFLTTILLAFPCLSGAAFDPLPIEELARAYAAAQPGLETYRSDVESKRLDELFAALTAGRPPETPRPAKPVLRRYWSRTAGKALVRVEGKNIFPAMQKAAEHFTSKNMLDPGSFFVPLHARETRRRLLKKAEVKAHETRLEESRTLHVELIFPEPVNLKGAFYGTALDLPQRSIKSLTLEIDPDLQILNRLELTLADEFRLNVEIRHEKLPRGGHIPREIRITTPSGSIDDQFVTSFADIQDFRLPREQVRTILRPGTREKRIVLFTNYRLNIPLPEEISRQLR